MQDKTIWPLVVILVLILLNLILVGWLLMRPVPKTEKPDHSHTIQQLYEITDGLGNMESVMEVLTLHGSIQYFADENNWLYFEQMAGGFRMMLGKDTDAIHYQEQERNGIRYSCIEEALGSEVAWEAENGYMFYLYSSLDMESLLYIAQHLEQRPESEEKT